ncbi:MAG: AarF/ABC1/UbiB kinase family protein [Acidobacteriota bacterium]|nr:AarF/ABC1/UbiB kinase family protein [Acidobacteriota bacterium]
MTRQTHVPRGKLRRSSIAGMAGAKAASLQIRHLSTTLLAGEAKREEQGRQTREEMAEVVFEAISRLRGTALKAAQLLCLEVDLVPDHIRQKLGKACYEVPPMSRATARGVLFSELGEAPESLFRDFEPEAFAAASLGQVHRAIGPGGHPLAVKIQYPGIGTTLIDDMKMIRTLIRMLPTGAHVHPRLVSSSLREIETRLVEEIDYEREAEQTLWFKAQLAHLEGIVIPDINEELSTELVLSSQRLDGCHLHQWLAGNPSQEERDAYARLLVAFFYHCIFELERIHADPNPGNYLFLPGGELGIIDFGCVQTFEPGFIQTIKNLIRSYLSGDFPSVVAIYRGLGMLEGAGAPEAYIDKLEPIRENVVRVSAAEGFDFSREPGFVGRMNQSLMNATPLMCNLPKGMTYYNRATTGLYRMLEQIGGRVDLRVPGL